MQCGRRMTANVLRIYEVRHRDYELKKYASAYLLYTLLATVRIIKTKYYARF